MGVAIEIRATELTSTIELIHQFGGLSEATTSSSYSPQSPLIFSEATTLWGGKGGHLRIQLKLYNLALKL